MKTGKNYCLVCNKEYDLNSEEELTVPWRKTIDCEDFCSEYCRISWIFD
jgi:hypothetical protein